MRYACFRLQPRKLLPLNSYLSGSNLRGCNLKQAYLIHSNMLTAELRGANMTNDYMQFAILKEAS